MQNIYLTTSNGCHGSLVYMHNIYIIIIILYNYIITYTCICMYFMHMYI